MVSLKEIAKVVNGLSLVVKESQVTAGDLQSLVKSAVLSATDVAGLTRGKLRRLDENRIPFQTQEAATAAADKSFRSTDNTDAHLHGEGKSSSSGVVYFTDSPAEADVATLPIQTTSNANTAAVDVPIQTTTSNASTVAADVPIQTTTSNANTAAVDVGVNTNDNLAEAGAREASVAAVEAVRTPQKQQRKPRERRVPSTPFSRALGFAGLGAGLAWGTLQESAKRIAFGTPESQKGQHALSPLMSDKNAERLALALCRMRGAALKLGQMLSIQDESLVPAPILAALDIVRQGADVMPGKQLNQVLDAELGSGWKSKLKSFDYEPMAAASIGQVHRAVTKDDVEVAIKIQYPGVADSIESDIDNVKLLLSYTNLIPEKLYIDNAMKVAKEELSRECNYELEAENQKRFRDLLGSTKGFYVPYVVDNLSCKRVLTTELVPGVPIDKVALLDQTTRNYVGEKLLELTLKELFVFRFMQTDPNWSNFLYDDAGETINLIDFGAARAYPKHFVDDYLRMVLACANSDRESVIEMSSRLGFLSGTESEVMLDAHVQAGFVVGLPFSKRGGYNFGSTNITQSLSNLGATMLRHRLTPPPEEAYSLHRKLSGAFLACIKLGAVVPCRELLLQVYENYQFGDDSGEILSRSII